MITIVTCGAMFIGSYYYCTYKDFKIENLSNDIKKQESIILDSEKFQNLYTLHQIMIEDTAFKEYIPPNFFVFKKYFYTSPDLIKLLHEALRGDILYKDDVPYSFEKAIIKYDIINHYIHKGYFSGKYLIKNLNADNLNNLKEKELQLNNEKQRLVSEKMTSEERMNFNLISYLVIFILFFIVRYLIYALRWSIKILNS